MSNRQVLIGVASAVLMCLTVAPAFAQEGSPTGGGAGMLSLEGAPTELVQAAGSGTAEQYWLRFGADSSATLWLFIDGSWRRMDAPSAQVTEAVQEAFCGCTEPLEVLAGYDDSVLRWVVVRQL